MDGWVLYPSLSLSLAHQRSPCHCMIDTAVALLRMKVPLVPLTVMDHVQSDEFMDANWTQVNHSASHK